MAGPGPLLRLAVPLAALLYCCTANIHISRYAHRPAPVASRDSAQTGADANCSSLAAQLTRVEKLLRTLISRLESETPLPNKSHRHAHHVTSHDGKINVHVYNAAPKVHVQNDVRAESRSESAAGARAGTSAAEQRSSQQSRAAITGSDSKPDLNENHLDWGKELDQSSLGAGLEGFNVR